MRHQRSNDAPESPHERRRIENSLKVISWCQNTKLNTRFFFGQRFSIFSSALHSLFIYFANIPKSFECQHTKTQNQSHLDGNKNTVSRQRRSSGTCEPLHYRSHIDKTPGRGGFWRPEHRLHKHPSRPYTATLRCEVAVL